MYNTIKKVIDSKNYELEDLLAKIDKRCFEGRISEEERDELFTKARENAIPENSYAPLEKQVEILREEVKALREEVKALKNGDKVEEEPADEYPEYVQPSGAHDTYKIGDKVTFEGKKYECLIDGCVWSPKAYPQGWREVTE